MVDASNRLRNEELNRVFLNALGSSALYNNGLEAKPLEVNLSHPSPYHLRVYLYNATYPPGGRTLGERKIQQGLPLHNSQDDATAVSDLITASTEDEHEFIDESESEAQAGRRYILVETMRGYRDSKFAPAVLQAYRYQCAVCQCALKLVDAAHIVPVSHPKSDDSVTNGIALCRLHHGAYDNALLGIRSDYKIIVNPEMEKRLSALKLQMGIDEFKSRLPELITIPASIEVRPDPKKLIVGLQARFWPPLFVA